MFEEVTMKYNFNNQYLMKEVHEQWVHWVLTVCFEPIL